MVVTTLMSFQFMSTIWGWSTPAAAAILVPLLLLETVFLGANLLKIQEGGWVPVALAMGVIGVMWTWTKGS
ncbi:KUP/HAK/KT family potassium transporter, partial [Rhizobium johnstonii]|uniref:KUP/HAK/KT family potassium transporter n=1 Tax=Rhizobium johnstonii TaxID=3019933 RepID=UPI003F985F50